MKQALVPPVGELEVSRESARVFNDRPNNVWLVVDVNIPCWLGTAQYSLPQTTLGAVLRHLICEVLTENEM